MSLNPNTINRRPGIDTAFWKWIYSIYAPNFEEVGGAYCFWDICASVLPSIRPSVTLLMHSITSEPCMLGYMDSSWKNSWPIFFSHQDYAPFLSYGPLKKYRWNLVSKISLKLLKLEPWNLVIDWYWWVDDLINFWTNSENYFMSYGPL